MVTALSKAPAKPKRAPLLPSETDNNGGHVPRSPESRDDVTSRYLSSNASSTNNSDSMTSSSSSSSSTTTSSLNSVCNPPLRRRFPSENSGNSRTGDTSATAKMLTKTSARSLSVSFQGQSFTLPVSKVADNGAPERRKAAAMAARNSENWSGRSRPVNFMSMSVDFTNEKTKLSQSRSAIVKNLRKSTSTETKHTHNKLEIPEIYKTVNKLVIDSDKSDHVRGGGPRAIVVPARFWQETINLLNRVQPGPVSPLMPKSNKLIARNILDDGPKLSPPRSSLSTFRGVIPRGSVRKKAIPSSLSTGMNGPSVTRNRVDSSDNLVNTSSFPSFSAELRRGKVGEKKLVDAQVLRLLHNKHLQWRFANAKVDAAMKVQRATSQKSLYNAWVTISKMWNSVLSKRVEVQQLKKNLKLHSILKKQISYLDNWDLSDRDHSISLAGTTLALESSALRLPVLCGAKADVSSLNEAIHAAIDVLQKMEVSVFSLLTKVEHVNSMASELVNTMKSESSLLDQSMDLLSTLTLLEVQDFSLRTHALQLVAPGVTTGL